MGASAGDQPAVPAPGDDPRVEAGSRTARRMSLALFCAGVAAFAPMYSPQGLLPEIANDFGVEAGTSSWAVGAATIGVALGVMPWARLSDRFGRVQMMRVALVCAIVIGLIAPFLPGFGWFIAARFFEGFALAAVPAIAVTAIAETVRPIALGGAVGTYIAGNTIGGLFGRILAAEVAERIGWHGGVAVTAGVSALFAVVFLMRMPRTAIAPRPGLPLIAGILDNLRTPGVMVLVAQAFLLMGGFVAVYNYLGFRLQHAPFELTLAQTSWIFLAYLAGALGSRWAWRFARKLTPTGVLLVCAVGMLAGLALTLLPNLIGIIVGLVLFTATFFAAHSIASGLTGRRGGAGKSFAPPLYSLGYYAGSSVLGWAGGVAFTALGWAGTAAMVAVVTVIAGVLAWVYARSQGGLRAADSAP